MESDTSFARQAEVCIGWSSFLPLGCQLQGCAVPFGCCPSLCVAVSRGSPFEKERWRPWLTETLAAHVGSVYVAVGSDTTTSMTTECNAV